MGYNRANPIDNKTERRLNLVFCAMRSYFYAVRVGRRPGIYPTWDEAKVQVYRFPAAEHQKFASFPLAYEYLRVRCPLPPTPASPQLPFLVSTAASFSPAQEGTAVSFTPAQESSQEEKETGLLEEGKRKGRYTMFADGGSRGNPGVAGSGFVLYSPEGEKVAEGAVPLPNIATNNEAEYTALLCGLQQALSLNIPKLHVLMDSKLVVYQTKGKWMVNSPNLIPLHTQVREKVKLFVKFSIEYVPREQNSEADALANKAMDTAEGSLPKSS